MAPPQPPGECMHACECVCTYMHECISTFVCCVYVSVCMCVCVCVCVCVRERERECVDLNSLGFEVKAFWTPE